MPAAYSCRSRKCTTTQKSDISFSPKYPDPPSLRHGNILQGTTEADNGLWWDFTTVGDTTPPNLSWISPVGDGQVYDVVDQIVQLEVDATDNVAINYIQFYRWDYLNLIYVAIGRLYTPPYILDLDTSTLLPDSNIVAAHAFDTSGNSSWKWIYLNHLDPAFSKSLPTDGETGIPTNPFLSWDSSAGAIDYEYCIDTIPNSVCDGSWTSVGNVTSVSLSGLNYNTTYHWQVHAINAVGTTEANNGIWWTFTTQEANNPPYTPYNPMPSNGSTNVTIYLYELGWYGGDPDNESVLYDVYLSPDGTNWTWRCSIWDITWCDLPVLNYEATYFWYVVSTDERGASVTGPTWSFTTQIAPPGDFNKIAPVNEATNFATNPTLSWQISDGATSYEYCIDTTNNNVCNTGYVSTGGSTNVDLSGLSYDTTYYWQVFAYNTTGGTEANADAWWSFTTVPAGACSLTWQAGINVINAASESGLLSIGQGPNATDGLDSACGEVLLPPKPPIEAFDVRLILPNITQASLNDYRSDSLVSVDWRIEIQSGTGGYPITITWDPAQLPNGSVYLKDLQGGNTVNVNMKQQNTYLLTVDYIDRLKIEYRQLVCKDITVTTGWNMVSVPVLAVDMSLAALFPDISPPAYYFTNAYQPVQANNTLEAGRGYWMYFTLPHAYQICGQPISQQDIPVNTGWNMIGPFESSMQVNGITSTPAGILSPPLYGYANGYAQASVLDPGEGYWAYVTQAGTLHMIAGAMSAPGETLSAQQPPNQPDDFRVPLELSSGESAVTLTIGVSPEGSAGFDIGVDALAPPPGPAGAFDARLTNTDQHFLIDVHSNREEEQVFQLEYQAGEEGDPIVLRWDHEQISRLGKFTIVDVLGGELFELDMSTTGELVIEPGSVLAEELVIRVHPLQLRYPLFLPLITY